MGLLNSTCNRVFSLAECNCSPCGTDSCHPQTGQCFCKAGVTGQHCDHCEVRLPVYRDGAFACRGCSAAASAVMQYPMGSCSKPHFSACIQHDKGSFALNSAHTDPLFPRRGTTASRDALAAGGVTVMLVPWGAAAKHRQANATACPASADCTASSVLRATGASVREAAEVSPASQLSGPSREGAGHGFGGTCVSQITREGKQPTLVWGPVRAAGLHRETPSSACKWAEMQLHSWSKATHSLPFSVAK